MSETNLQEIERLTVLARKIRSLHDSATKSASLAKDKLSEALSEALLCGQALIEAKQLVKHGEWLQWLADHCKRVSEVTAQRYMRLAKNVTVTDLSDASSIRRAYLATGIISEDKCENQKLNSEKNQPISSSDQPQQSARIGRPTNVDSAEHRPGAGSASGAEITPSKESDIQQEQQPISPSSFEQLTQLGAAVERVMKLIDELGQGSINDVLAELSPISDWLGKHTT